MKAVIHRGNDYVNSLRVFQEKRMSFITGELKQYSPDAVWAVICRLRSQGHTLSDLLSPAV